MVTEAEILVRVTARHDSHGDRAFPAMSLSGARIQGIRMVRMLKTLRRCLGESITPRFDLRCGTGLVDILMRRSAHDHSARVPHEFGWHDA